jgi:hypothetical protein
MGVAAYVFIFLLFILPSSTNILRTLHITLLANPYPTFPLYVLNFKVGNRAIVLYRNDVRIHLSAILGQTL